jgi:hypothetical protein
VTDPEAGSDRRDGPPRAARWLVGAALVLLLIPGLVGFDAWPLTGWRLFSLARDEDQTRWVLEAVGADGDTRIVSLEELPLRYRNAEWQMAELPDASATTRDAVCGSLAEAVLRVVPRTAELRIVRDRQRLVDVDGGWKVEHDMEVFHACEAVTQR